jgi:hypothetical protein
MAKVWLEQVRKLPGESDVPAKTIIKVMTWAIAHPYCTSRVTNMGNLVFNWDELYDQYRGDLRKKKLEDQADSPSLIALRQKYPGMLKHALVDAEIKERHGKRIVPITDKCECRGEYVPCKQIPGINVPCRICKPATDKIWREVEAEVNTEVWGDPRGEQRW